MRAFSVDSTAWPVIRSQRFGGAGGGGPCWAAVSRGQVGRAGPSQKAGVQDSLPGAGSSRCRWAARAAVWLEVEACARARGSGRGWDSRARRLHGDGRLPAARSGAVFASRPVSEVAPPGLASGAASWRPPLLAALLGASGLRRKASTRSSSATAPRTHTSGCWSPPLSVNTTVSGAAPPALLPARLQGRMSVPEAWQPRLRPSSWTLF